MTNLIKKAKKIIAGAGLIALSAVANVDASENNISQEERARINRAADDMFNKMDKKLQKNKAEKQAKRPASSNEEKLVKEGLQELELEKQFQKSPYLYQRYEGYVDRYIKAAKKQQKDFEKGATATSPKKVAEVVAKRDARYLSALCDNQSYTAEFEYDTEIKNGERHLVYNENSYIVCEWDSGYVEVFKFARDHCAPDRRSCRPAALGHDIVCGCHGINEFEQEDELSPILNFYGDEASLKKANDKKAAMVQSMLYVNGR